MKFDIEAEIKNLEKNIESIRRYLWLKKAEKSLQHIKEISVVNFDHSDVVRHPLVSKIVKAYSEKKND